MVETRCFAAGSCKVEFRAAPETVSLRHLPATAARSRPAPAPVLPLRNRNKPRLPQAHFPSREPSLCPPKPAENRRRCPATGRPPQPAGKGVPRTGAPAPHSAGDYPGPPSHCFMQNIPQLSLESHRVPLRDGPRRARQRVVLHAPGLRLVAIRDEMARTLDNAQPRETALAPARLVNPLA